jgi:hypothetical protein
MPNGGARKAGYTSKSLEARCVVKMGDLLLRTARHKRGSLEFNGYDCSSRKTSVGMYKLKKAMEKFCSDILASHQRMCDCALAGMAI